MASTPRPTEPALPEVLKMARWLVNATGYPFDLSTSVAPPKELRVAVYEAWVEKDGVHEDELDALWDNLCDEGRWQ